MLKQLKSTFPLVAATLALLVFGCGGHSGIPPSPDVSGIMDPEEATVLVGNSRSYLVSILPRGNFEGTVNLVAETGLEDVNCTPSNFSVILTKGQTTPALETIRVSAFATTEPGPVEVRITHNGNRVCSATATIITGSEPGFTFTANPTTVFANSDFPSGDVTFTLTSVGGFSGDVTINYTPDGQIEVIPSTNNLTLNLAVGETKTFTRRFRRNATHSAPIVMDFTAEKSDGSGDQTARVTVNPSTG